MNFGAFISVISFLIFLVECRPQHLQPQHEDVFHPEPPVQYYTQGWPQYFYIQPYHQPIYQQPQATIYKPPTNFIYEDPESFIIDNYLENLRQLPMQKTHKQTTTSTTTTTMRPINNFKIIPSLKPEQNYLFYGDNNAFHNQAADTIRLILKPSARSIAGNDGKAIANPQARAILRHGANINVLFEPDAVAVAGPGGIAHAESDLEIIDPKTPVKITLLPFYGGAKGQTLQITETVDGSVSTDIINAAITTIKPQDNYEIENPTLPPRIDSQYGENIKNIHNSALSIIKLQEVAKRNGLSEKDELQYRELMETINQSAHNLAKIYENNDNDSNLFSTRAGLSSWLSRKKPTATTTTTSTKKDKDKKKEEEEKKRKEDEERRKKEEEEKKKKEAEEKKKREEAEKKRKEEEEKKKKKEKEEEEGEDEDTVDINPPPEEASVAEAKPVGLAVAGVGGVASSKPIATAVVGPGGLAIARPVGTAIAGVSPDQALVPIYAEGFVVPTKTKGGSDKKHTHSTEYINKIISKYHQI